MPAKLTTTDEQVRSYVAHTIKHIRKHLDLDRMYNLGMLYSLESYLTFHSKDDETTFQCLGIINSFRHKISLGETYSLKSPIMDDQITRLDAEVKA